MKKDDERKQRIDVQTAVSSSENINVTWNVLSYRAPVVTSIRGTETLHVSRGDIIRMFVAKGLDGKVMFVPGIH